MDYPCYAAFHFAVVAEHNAALNAIYEPHPDEAAKARAADEFHKWSKRIGVDLYGIRDADTTRVATALETAETFTSKQWVAVRRTINQRGRIVLRFSLPNDRTPRMTTLDLRPRTGSPDDEGV